MMIDLSNRYPKDFRGIVSLILRTERFAEVRSRLRLVHYTWLWLFLWSVRMLVTGLVYSPFIVLYLFVKVVIWLYWTLRCPPLPGYVTAHEARKLIRAVRNKNRLGDIHGPEPSDFGWLFYVSRELERGIFASPTASSLGRRNNLDSGKGFEELSKKAMVTLGEHRDYFVVSRRTGAVYCNVDKTSLRRFRQIERQQPGGGRRVYCAVLDTTLQNRNETLRRLQEAFAISRTESHTRFGPRLPGPLFKGSRHLIEWLAERLVREGIPCHVAQLPRRKVPQVEWFYAPYYRPETLADAYDYNRSIHKTGTGDPWFVEL